MKAMIAAAVFAALPLAAGAVTIPVTEITPGLFYGTGSSTGSVDVTFSFVVPTALENFTVELSGTGLLGAAPLAYSLNGAPAVPVVTPFYYNFAIGDVGAGTYDVTYDFTGTSSLPVSVTASVYGTAPAPVPLPAAGALGAAGVIALGALKARRKKA